MRRRTIRVICLAFFLLVFGAGLTWVVLRAFLAPTTRASSIPIASVNFLGYTNDASGARLATFAVTNLGDIAVARSPKCLICVAAPGGRWVPHSGFLLAKGRVLGVGASETIAIKPPTTQSPWRVSLYISNEVGLAWTGKRLINAVLRLLGRPCPYGAATRQVDSERIESRT